MVIVLLCMAAGILCGTIAALLIPNNYALALAITQKFVEGFTKLRKQEALKEKLKREAASDSRTERTAERVNKLDRDLIRGLNLLNCTSLHCFLFTFVLTKLRLPM